LRSQTTLSLPARVRQLSSDGRLVYALLSNRDVYVLKPELIVAESGNFLIEGMEDVSRYFYRGGFRSAGYPANVPLRIEGTPQICRIGGAYLHACNGRLLLVDRSYYWHMTSMAPDRIRAPGDHSVGRPVSGTGGERRAWV